MISLKNLRLNLYYVNQTQFCVHDFGIIHRLPYKFENITPLAMMRRIIKNVNSYYPTNESMQSFRQNHYGLSWNSMTSLENNALFSATAIRGELLRQPHQDETMIIHALDNLYLPSFNSETFINNDRSFDEEKSYNLYRFQQIQ